MLFGRREGVARRAANKQRRAPLLTVVWLPKPLSTKRLIAITISRCLAQRSGRRSHRRRSRPTASSPSRWPSTWMRSAASSYSVPGRGLSIHGKRILRSRCRRAHRKSFISIRVTGRVRNGRESERQTKSGKKRIESLAARIETVKRGVLRSTRCVFAEGSRRP